LPVTRFAVIGDYGYDSDGERDVAELIRRWEPEFILTVGDNNYPDGDPATMDINIGKYFHEFIGNYVGAYGTGADTNRFFPVLGNHDIFSGDVAASYKAYREYFTLPGNEAYYDFAWGPLHLFALDTVQASEDHYSLDSEQAQWLKQGLAQALEPWKLIFFHYPPYSSTKYEVPRMRWPFKEWGASAVLTGHAHVYERLIVDGLPYFVNGLGGRNLQEFTENPVAGSKIRYNAGFGTMLVEATSAAMTFQFVNLEHTAIDTYTITTS
jgi:hypothetical protein